jgi:class 3 adenylate cyclase/tetratricopeptide (TPR) repeat protein
VVYRKWLFSIGRNAMRSRCLGALKDAGLSDEIAEQLVPLIVTPPPGTFDESELENADTVRVCLLGAIVAAVRHHEYAAALKQLLGRVGQKVRQMSQYDQGRYWHLKGFAAWRLDGSIDQGLHFLTRSIQLIQDNDSDCAKAYYPRVLDVFGQLLHHNGQLQDARAEFELAVKYREELDDEAGLALSLGNLGRLFIDLGDFRAAKACLLRDLEIVKRISPEMTQLRSALLTQLATSAFQLESFDEAKQLLAESEKLAGPDENAVGLCFIAITRGQIAVRQDEISTAERLADFVLSMLADSKIPESYRNPIAALGLQLSAEVDLAKGNIPESLKKFESSRQRFALVANVSPVLVAAVLRSYAKATHAVGDLEQTARLMREALERLDATSADVMRASIEGDLKEHFRDSWLLHSAGRFIGQKHIEFLLNEGGHAGFRGTRKDVAILFADIRGFTAISELYTPESLVMFLNEFLGCMTRCVQYFDGIVDKFIGDALMALFSLPNPQQEDPENSLLAALMMKSELARFNHKLPRGTPPLEIGIGIHFGSTVAGLIGSPQKRSYTVIGDAVNLASRLEGMTKQLGASILITDELVQQLKNPDRFLLRPLGQYAAKGRAQSVTVYDLMGEKEICEYGGEMHAEIEQLKAALELFSNRDFRESKRIFRSLTQSVGESKRGSGYELLAETSDQYATLKLPEDWNGTIALRSK